MRSCSLEACERRRILSGSGRCLQCEECYCLTSYGTCMYEYEISCRECKDDKCVKCFDGYSLDEHGICSASKKLEKRLKSATTAVVSVPIILIVIAAVAITVIAS